MKINIFDEEIDFVGLEDGAYSLNILIRVENGIPHYSVDIGSYVSRTQQSESLLQGDLEKGDFISVTI